MTDEPTNGNFLERVLAWLHAGFPEGVPPTDYFPLLALLKRSLSEEEVVQAAQAVLKSTTADVVTAEEIQEAIAAVTEKEPHPEEIRQVAARLALVGWPLEPSH